MLRRKNDFLDGIQALPSTLTKASDLIEHNLEFRY